MVRKIGQTGTDRDPPKALWQCPTCGESFTTPNQWHSCGRHSLEELFARCEPHVVRIYEKFASMVQECGPVKIIPQKTRVTFQVRMRFVSLYPRKSHLLGGFVFGRRHEDPRFHKIETFSKRNHVHYFRLDADEQLDAGLRAWIAEAYAVGEQKHLRN